MSIDYADVIDRIHGIYNSCSAQEQSMLKKILTEISTTGDSETLERIWLADFKEIPVSIERFLKDPLYLGNTNDQGNMIYPGWWPVYHDIFDTSRNIFEVCLSGATRIGKTSTAVSCMAYMTYLLMCYRNPQKYFRLKDISAITIAFANLTKDLAAGVAFREYMQTLKESQWFLDHGRFSNSVNNPVYYPEGDKIDIIPASDAAHVLGMQLWACLTGDTKVVLSDRRIVAIEDLVDAEYEFIQYSSEGELVPATAYVRKTREVTETIKIYFDKEHYLEGTPDHKILVSTGEYKQLQDISFKDKILSTDSLEGLSPIKIEYSKHQQPIPVYDVIDAKPYHNFLIKCGDHFVVSHNCIMDEVNFARAGVKDISISKNHMKQLYNTANARITGTFKLRGKVYGKLFSCSSKNTDSDYLSEHIQEQLDAGNTTMYLFDKPQWEVQPAEKFSTERFYITIGDRFKRGFVVPPENEDELHLQDYRDQGYEILEVPEDFKPNFKADYDIALRDIAGISVVGAMGFITQEIITPCVAEDRHNPFFVDILWIGSRDNDTLERNFHSEVVPSRLKSLPMYIHIDFAETSDHIGISGVVENGTKLIVDAVTQKKLSVPFFSQVFQIAIGAPRGDRMSFQKVIDFIVWLRRNGFHIAQVSTDQYQSSYVRETLSQQGFATAKISVDRTEDPYIALRNLLQDQRIDLVKHQLQEDELVNLQRINGRIDHKPQSTGGSAVPSAANGWNSKGIGKDSADALAGSAFAALQAATETKPEGHSISRAFAAVNNPGMYKHRMPSIMNSPYRKITR